MIEIIGHHTCKNQGNLDILERKKLPLAYSEYKLENNSNPFLGSGYYFWDYNMEQAKEWGKIHYQDRYYIFEAQIPYNDAIMLDLVGNRQHIAWLLGMMKEFEYENLDVGGWEIGKFIEHLKQMSMENEEFRDMFPYQIVRAIDHSFNPYLSKFYFESGKSDRYINLNPRIIVCVINATHQTIKNFKLVFEK